MTFDEKARMAEIDNVTTNFDYIIRTISGTIHSGTVTMPSSKTIHEVLCILLGEDDIEWISFDGPGKNFFVLKESIESIEVIERHAD